MNLSQRIANREKCVILRRNENESGIINANNAQCMTTDAECTMNNDERCITNPLSPFCTLIRFDRLEFRVP